jgi:hypothetical protein
MARANPARGGCCRRRFVGAPVLRIGEVLEADAECIKSLELARRDGGYDRAVEPAAQEAAYGYIGQQPALDRLFDDPPRLGDDRDRSGPGQRLACEAVAVGAQAHPAIVGDQRVAARQRPDVTIDRRGLRDPQERRKVPDSLPVEFQIETGEGRERRDLRGKRDRAAAKLAVVQRLLARDVPRENELALRSDPQCRGKHAIEALEELLAMIGVEVTDDLAVRASPESLPLRLELATELGIVVDLPVVE